jgi:capsular exopolysaccharide synthesis family protein
MPENQSLSPRGPRLPETVHPPAGQLLDIEAQVFDSFSYLRTYWNIIIKRRWAIMSVAVIMTSLAAIASFKMTPIYEATVRLDIEADTPQIQSLNDLYRDMQTYGDEAFIGTQIQVLEGATLAQTTIEQLGLTKNPRWVAAIQQLSAPVSSNVPTSPDELVSAFAGDLHIQRVRDSHVVNVSFESADPTVSSRVANSLADNYIEYNFKQKYDATRQASGWMEQQLDELKAKVEKSQMALVDYEKRHAIVNISDKENVVEQKMADLSRDLTAAQSERLQKESVYELARSDESQVAFVAQNDLLQHLEEKYADLKSQYVDTVQQSGPKHPKALRLQSQVDEIQSLIERERKRTVERMRNDYMAAVGRERLLTAAVAKEKVEVGALNQLLIQHNLLKRESESNQQLYDSLLQRLKDATVSAGLRATNIHVIDRAKPPKSPVRPQKFRNILIGLTVGLVLGLALAFVMEAMDTSIKTVDEAERLANAPALAIVPFAPNTLRQPSLSPPRGNGNSATTHGLALLSRPSSAVAESFRTLLTSVVLSTAPQPPQMLLVTSSMAGEGKTVTALNLAIALAQSGEKTLIIDADLRHPKVGASLDMDNRAGLASFLTGAHSIEKALFKFPAVPTLWAIPAGPKSPNPTQLLSSTAMESMLGELRKRFKFVVIDSPPILPVADGMILSTFVDGVVFIVESGVTGRNALTRARKILHNSGANVLGIVFNKVDLRFDGYYGSYSHYNYYYNPHDKGRNGDSEVADLPSRR